MAAFRPRTSPPTTATVLRLILWPLAILFVIHRSFILATNGYITDDFGPVYRAVVNLKMGWDIYNEHFNYVDPHYLYPPGGTLLMAPFGYLPVDASRYWFITFNTIAIVLAAYLLVRLFGYGLNSVALPALLAAMFVSESVINTLVFGNINGCILFLEILFFRWLLDGKVSHQWWAGIAIGLTLVVKPLLAPLLLLPLLNRQWRALVAAFAVPLVFNLAAVLSPVARFRVNDPMNFVTETLRYIVTTRDYFNSSIAGNGLYYGLPTWLILLLQLTFAVLAVLSLWLLYKYYRTRDPLLWMTDFVRRAADHVVPGAVAGPGLLLDDVVPVPDDSGAAEFRDPQLAGVGGDLRVHERRQVASRTLAVDRPFPGVHEGHLRLVPDADRGFRRAVLPLSRRQIREPSRRRHRPIMDEGRHEAACNPVDAPQAGLRGKITNPAIS